MNNTKARQCLCDDTSKPRGNSTPALLLHDRDIRHRLGIVQEKLGEKIIVNLNARTDKIKVLCCTLHRPSSRLGAFGTSALLHDGLETFLIDFVFGK